MAQMTALRRRMIDDMTVRDLSPATQQSYVYAVAKFSRFFACSPDRLGIEEVRAYQLHLAGLGWSWSHINQVSCALRFFFGVTLDRPGAFDRIISAKEPKKLPVVLLKRKHVTLAMLWDEYIERDPEGYRYSRFCELYRGWASRLSVTMRQAHIGGDKLFVDYGGDTVPVIVDRLTGQLRPAQIFVAVMGASSFTYAEASWTQALADWIGAHTRVFAAIGGVPK